MTDTDSNFELSTYHHMEQTCQGFEKDRQILVLDTSIPYGIMQKLKVSPERSIMRFAYSKTFWDRYFEKSEIQIDLLKNPSLLLVGESGSGKSWALKWLILNLLKEQPIIDLWFCNFKDSIDFRFMKAYKQYFTGSDCEEGFLSFYHRFCEIQSTIGEDISYPSICIFDEFPAFILRTINQDKKKADSYLRMVSEMLMFFRSYKGGLWFVCQRADSVYFPYGARDNFHSKILLTRGRPSKESLNMLGFTHEDLSADTYQVGEGIAYIDGQGLFEVKYPVYDSHKIESEILKQLEHAAVCLL